MNWLGRRSILAMTMGIASPALLCAPLAFAQIWDRGTVPIARTVGGEAVEITPVWAPPPTTGGFARLGLLVGGQRYTLDVDCRERMARLLHHSIWEPFTARSFAPAVGRLFCDGQLNQSHTVVPNLARTDTSTCVSADLINAADGSVIILILNDCPFQTGYNLCTRVSGRLTADYFPGTVAPESAARHVLYTSEEESVTYRYNTCGGEGCRAVAPSC